MDKLGIFHANQTPISLMRKQYSIKNYINFIYSADFSE